MPEASNNSAPTGNKNSVQVTDQANFIWNIANKLRGAYMPDKYGDVIIPMTIVRRFECSLADTKKEILEKVKIIGYTNFLNMLKPEKHEELAALRIRHTIEFLKMFFVERKDSYEF